MQQTSLFSRTIQQLAPGAIHVPNWLSLEEQQQLLEQCREWAKPPAGLYTPKMLDGKPLSVRVLCLGWHWYPYQYSKTRDDNDRLPCKSFPQQLGDLAGRALRDTLPQYARFQTDVAIINWDDWQAKLGMHQDRSESALVRNAGSPIVSISLGDSCIFRFGNNQTKGALYQDIELRSGDLFVFGSVSRMAYHGVLKIYPGTAPQALALKQGRLNITIRETGLIAAI
ncbi:MAG: alpha-ketoglutarate-dependent dioxygenase AlkB [Tatlockia sp.]|nr:alpha-ketoglutarate-dependent dioxygenase AlkB [Tatlockia sp.]